MNIFNDSSRRIEPRKPLFATPMSLISAFHSMTCLRSRARCTSLVRVIFSRIVRQGPAPYPRVAEHRCHPIHWLSGPPGAGPMRADVRQTRSGRIIQTSTVLCASQFQDARSPEITERRTHEINTASPFVSFLQAVPASRTGIGHSRHRR